MNINSLKQLENKYNDIKKINIVVNSDDMNEPSNIQSVVNNIFNIFNEPKTIIDKHKNLYNYPTLNLCSDYIDDYINMSYIIKDNVYNKREFVCNFSDKTYFYRKMMGKEYVPNFCFSKDSVLEKLSFPVVAKKKYKDKNKCCVKIINNEDELLKANNDYKIFIKKINIKKEYHCLCLKGVVMSLLEKDLNFNFDNFDSCNSCNNNHFLKYKWCKTDVKSFTHLLDLNVICNDISKEFNIDYFCVKFAIDDSGKLWVIKVNCKPKLYFDECVTLYKCVFRDFYGRCISDYTNDILNDLRNGIMNNLDMPYYIDNKLNVYDNDSLINRHLMKKNMKPSNFKG